MRVNRPLQLLCFYRIGQCYEAFKNLLNVVYSGTNSIINIFTIKLEARFCVSIFSMWYITKLFDIFLQVMPKKGKVTVNIFLLINYR